MTDDDETSALAEIEAFIQLQTQQLDQDLFAPESARALYALNRKLDRESSLEALTARLTHTLKDASPASLEEKLCRQAQVLDAAFNWLMTDGATSGCKERDKYKAAFQAQKLFRQSLQVLEDRKAQKTSKRTIKRTDMTQRQWNDLSRNLGGNLAEESGDPR